MLSRMSGGQDPRAGQPGDLTRRLGLNRIPLRTDSTSRKAPRHCWIDGCPELPPGRRAGLLLEWRRTDSGWLGRVIVALDGTEGPAVLTLWVRSEHLRPA